MERDALEAGRTMADEDRQFNLESEADYWDRYEEIVRDAHNRGEFATVD